LPLFLPFKNYLKTIVYDFFINYVAGIIAADFAVVNLSLDKD
jgi:hypothetical protein